MSLVDEIRKMLIQAKENYHCAATPATMYHSGGRVEALEDVLKLIIGQIK